MRLRCARFLHLDSDIVAGEGMIELGLDEARHVGLVLGEDARHFCQCAGAIIQRHRQLPHRPDRAVAPGQIDPVIIDPACQFEAVDRVHQHGLALAADADDAISRHRVAARGQFEGDAGVSGRGSKIRAFAP